MVCRPAIGLCVPADAQNDTPPDVIPASVTLSRTAIGVQVPLQVSFEVTDDLLVDPIVVLGTAPPRPLTRTSVDGRRYTYTLSLDAPTAESAASISCTLVGRGGTEATGITLGPPVTLDFTAPVLSVFTPPTTPLGAGAVGSVIITVTDALSMPPELVGSDGTVLRQDATFTPPLYGFFYDVPATATDGPVTVTVTLTDAADNVFESSPLDCFTVDVTPPTVAGAPQLIRTSARAGQLVGVVVTMSEPLAASPVAGMQGPSHVALPQTGVALTEHTFSRSLPSGLADGAYLVQLESFSDRAGNPGIATDLGTLSVDGAPPQFVVNPDVQPRTVSGVSGFDIATVTFSLGEDLGNDPLVVNVRVGEQEPTCSVTPAAANRFDYSCTLASFVGSAEGGLPVTVLVTDPSGNSTFRAGPPLLVDLTAPIVVGTPQITRSDVFLRASLGPNDVLLSATSPTQGGVPYVTVTFVVSESLTSAPSIRMDSETLTTPELTTGTSIGQLFTFEIRPALGRADGPYSVIAEVTDAAGNSADLALGTLRIDRTPPTLSQAVADTTRYVRAPWGSATETTRLAMNATFEPDSTVLVVSDSSLAFGAVLAIDDLDGSGASTDLPILNNTYPQVWLALRDRAGNPHDNRGVAVRNGLWVAGFGGKESGDLERNPHELFTTSIAWDTQEPWLHHTREPSNFEYAGVTASGGAYVGTSTDPTDGDDLYGGSPVHPVPPVRPQPRLLNAMAYDPISKTDVMFGGIARLGGSALADTWQWNGNAWNQALSGPSGVIQTAMATLDGTPTLGGVALFGGTGATSNSFSCNLWRWNGSTWIQNPGDLCTGGSSFPVARYRHAMAFDPTRGWLIVTGGSCQSGFNQPPINCGDIWVNRNVFGTQMAWTQSLIPFPSSGSALARNDHGMAYDAGRDVLVIYSGSENGDLWEYAMASQVWTYFPATGGWPQPRRNMLLTYDVARGRILMAGGKNGSNQNVFDAWTWDGASWRQLNSSYCDAPVEPECLRDFVFVASDGASTYDKARHQVVHFVPDSGPGPATEAMFHAGFGPAYRSATLGTFNLAQAQVQTAWITNIDIEAVAGGTGLDDDGNDMPGVLAELWSGNAAGAWTTVGASSADVLAMAPLDGGLTGALARTAVDTGKVRARIITEWPAGPESASVAVDLLELKVAYTIP